jgi:serine protease Do/serine protease DegQ
MKHQATFRRLKPLTDLRRCAAVLLAAVVVAVPALDASAQLPGSRDVPTLAPVIDQAGPAVVNISIRGSVVVDNPLSNDPFFRRFFQVPPNGRREFRSAGSGVIVDAAEGYILTNHHVVENADEITITLADDRSLVARVIGSDPGSDIAVVQVEPNNLTEMPLGDSDDVRVGDFVLAIGNPFGLQHTVTSGIVSGLGRSGINPEGYEDFIQTDASINPGNSGGALINLSGELVGINSAILSGSGGNIGIGFAIPVNMARSIMDQLISYGSVQRGLLGVSIAPLSPEIAENYELDSTSGALITAVSTGSAAEQAGLQIGDVIVSVNGNAVTDPAALRNTIGLLRPSDRVEVGYVRDGRRRTATATLDELDAPALAQEEEGLAEIDPAFEGATLVANNETLPDYNGVPGILVTEVEAGSTAAVRGLRPNDIITHINRQRVRSLTEAREIIGDARSIIVQVQRGDRGLLLLMR